jgi:general secretion pathway protein D
MLVNLIRVVSLFILATAGGVALAACNTTYLEQRTDQPQDAADIMKAADLRPRYPQPTGTVDTGGANSPKPFSFFGSSAPALPANAPAPGSVEVEAVGGGYTLNFEDTPVANVVKSVLGDVLGVSYVIDPRAQGSITLSSERPVAKKDMLFVIENALRANNLNMLRDGSGYRIVPTADPGVGAVDRGEGGSVEPGYGLSVIPVQYVSGATLSKLLEGFAARPGAIRTDSTGKLLIVVGTGSERQAALDTVRSFDVDWMRGQSVGLYPVQNSTPEPIVGELEKIFDSGDSGLAHGLVKFEAVSRLNAILVVASKPELLRTAASWVSRLDEPSGASASVKVYKVRYGDARQIAQMLTQIFVADAGSGEAPTNEIAPESGAKALATTSRLTGGNPSSSNAPAPLNASAPGGGANPGVAGANSRGAQFGGVPVATVNAELSALGFGQGGSGGPQMANVRITADTVNNSLLIYAKAEEYKIIERTLNQLDRPRLQVAIEVTIAEVTLNAQLNYGVQYALSHGVLSNTLNGQIPSLVNNYSSSPSGPPLNGGLNVIVGNGVLPRVVINALHNLTDVKILSNPSLVVVDNGEATLEVGDQIPIATGSATVLSANNAVVNTVDYKNTGIIMHVQPRVNSNGSVLLNIDQEVSAVENTGGTTSQNLTPTITERKVSSEISVVSGQTVLLAGLIQDQQQQSRQGIPILNQLPYVGAAFGTTGTSQARTELIIFIRPQIIRDGVDASMVAEELRAKMRGGKVQAVTPAALNVLARPVQ